MRGLITLLFLAIAFYSVSADDKFIFNVTLNCGYHQRTSYTYNLQFLEHDYWILNGNDKITPQKIGEARPGVARIMMQGSQNGDENWSSGYDVIMHLYHDCSEYESEMELTLNIKPQCEIGKGICRYVISKDIKDVSGEMDYQAKLSYE
ncbi:hypothetical protein CRE_08159 [Caenorhabditis remanei]|uniref:Uncharacterized protein n=1 Tax=Caenorhabditis remanei TaxID=31234 RepID=E3M3R5_CAERE|nr:hypothetical protein CRE_08159 [Caenorhabditis remanei]